MEKLKNQGSAMHSFGCKICIYGMHNNFFINLTRHLHLFVSICYLLVVFAICYLLVVQHCTSIVHSTSFVHTLHICDY